MRKREKRKEEGNKSNKIEVVGKVSEKLNALIQRLQQNQQMIENSSYNNYGEKVVMGQKIKVAVEKFNKRIEERPKYRHYEGGGKKYKKRQINEEKDNKGELPKYDEEKKEEEEDYEYEEDEEYEYEEYEEEEENDKNEENKNEDNIIKEEDEKKEDDEEIINKAKYSKKRKVKKEQTVKSNDSIAEKEYNPSYRRRKSTNG